MLVASLVALLRRRWANSTVVLETAVVVELALLAAASYGRVRWLVLRAHLALLGLHSHPLGLARLVQLRQPTGHDVSLRCSQTRSGPR